MNNTLPKWPTHPNGRPMKMGEMTKEQQLEQARAACEKLKPELERIVRHFFSQESN